VTLGDFARRREEPILRHRAQDIVGDAPLQVELDRRAVLKERLRLEVERSARIDRDRLRRDPDDNLGIREIDHGDGGSRDAIDPLTFWRQITDRDCYRGILFDPATGTAEVTVHRDVWGDLHIVDENMVEYVKPFQHEGIRYANFVRDPDWEPPGGNGGQGQGGQGQGDQGSNGGQGQGQINGHRHRRGPWVLTELSGFLSHSDTLTISIDWIRVETATVDVTISDPLELKAVPDEILTF